MLFIINNRFALLSCYLDVLIRFFGPRSLPSLSIPPAVHHIFSLPPYHCNSIFQDLTKHEMMDALPGVCRPRLLSFPDHLSTSTRHFGHSLCAPKADQSDSRATSLGPQPARRHSSRPARHLCNFPLLERLSKQISRGGFLVHSFQPSSFSNTSCFPRVVGVF